MDSTERLNLTQLQAALNHAGLGVHAVTGRTDQTIPQIIALYPNDPLVVDYLKAQTALKDFKARVENKG